MVGGDERRTGSLLATGHGVLVAELMLGELVIEHQDGGLRARDVLGRDGLGDEEVLDDLSGDDTDGVVASLEDLHGQLDLLCADVEWPGGSGELVLDVLGHLIHTDTFHERELVAVDRCTGTTTLGAGLFVAGLGRVVVRANGLGLLVLLACHGASPNCRWYESGLETRFVIIDVYYEDEWIIA